MMIWSRVPSSRRAIAEIWEPPAPEPLGGGGGAGAALEGISLRAMAAGFPPAPPQASRLMTPPGAPPLRDPLAMGRSLAPPPRRPGAALGGGGGWARGAPAGVSL